MDNRKAVCTARKIGNFARKPVQKTAKFAPAVVVPVKKPAPMRSPVQIPTTDLMKPVPGLAWSQKSGKSSLFFTPAALHNSCTPTSV